MAVLPEHNRQRIFTLIAFFLAILLIIASATLEVIKFHIRSSLREQWSILERQIATEAAHESVLRFQRLQEQLQERLRTSIEKTHLSDIVQSDSVPSPELFDAAERMRGDASESVEILSTMLEGSVIAWAGRTIDVPHEPLAAVRDGKSASFIDVGAINTYLVVLLPVGAPSSLHRFAALLAVPIEINYPIANRFVRGRHFSREVSEELGADVRFVFRNVALPAADSSSIVLPLKGLSGKQLGHVEISPPPYEVYVESQQDRIGNIEAVLLSIAALILSFLSARRILILPSVATRSVLLLFDLWALRIIWLLNDFPFNIVVRELGDPSFFASRFAFGLARSPGDFLLTSLAFVTSAALCAREFLSGKFLLATTKPSALIKILGVPLGLIVGGSLFWGWRGIVAAVKSAVMDSTLDYGNSASLLFSAPEAAVVISLIGLVLGFLLVVGIIIQSLRFVLFDNKTVKTHQVVVLGFMPIIGGMVGWWISPQPLMGWYVALLLLIFVMLVSILFTRVRILVWCFVSVITSAFIVGSFLAREQVIRTQQRIELLASNYTKSQDTWLTYLVQEVLRSAESSAIKEIMSGSNMSTTDEERSILAFLVWAQSVLGKQGYGAAIKIYNADKQVVSQFAIGRQSKSVSPLLSNTVRQPTVWVAVEHRAKVYLGVAPIKGANGEILGYVGVAVPSSVPLPFSGGVPEPLLSELSVTRLDPLFNLRVERSIDLRQEGDSSASLHRELTKARQYPHWVTSGVTSFSYLVNDPSDPHVVWAFSIDRPDQRWDAFVVLKVMILMTEVSLGIVVVLIVAGLLYRRRFSFRLRLLGALLLVSILPVLYLAIEDSHDAERRFDEFLSLRLRDALGVVSRLFPLQTMSISADSVAEQLARAANVDVLLYRDFTLVGSSTPELFNSGLLDNRLNGTAYAAIVLEGRQFFQHLERIGDFTYAVGYTPVRLLPFDGKRGDERLILSIPLLYRQGQVDEEIARKNVYGIWPYVGMIVFAGLLGWVISRRISAPVLRLTEAARKVSRGDLTASVTYSSRDELDELVQTFNLMVRDLRDSQAARLRAEREAAWREMAKQVAHEIKNPLTPMKLGIQQLLEAYRAGDPRFSELLERVARTVVDRIESLRRIASEFSYFARMPEPQFAAVNPSELLSEAAALFESESDVAFVRDFADTSSVVLADRDQLSRLFINVIRNAIQATRQTEGAQIVLRTERANSVIIISISDNGPGIPPEVRPHLFEPNFSTKSEGMGLGLAVVKQILELHGGEVEVETEVGKGTTFSFKFPILAVQNAVDGGSYER